MKKKVLCTALAVTMLLTTTASATAKPWWLSKYRVTFDNELGIVGNITLQFASDGSSFIRPITKRYGESISLENYVPTKYGYTFKGWFTDPRTKQNQVTTFKFTKPDVLYAKWEKNSEEPLNPNDEIMAKDTCYLTDEETKIRNEIIEEKNKVYIKTINDNTEKDEILKDIYKLKRLKFKSYTKTDMSKVTEKIKQELCRYGISEKAPLPLMGKIVSKFYIGGEKGLQIKLINEKILEREG